MAQQKKCKNPACSCTTNGDNYCSAACEATKGSNVLMCNCGHPGCKGDAMH